MYVSSFAAMAGCAAPLESWNDVGKLEAGFSRSGSLCSSQTVAPLLDVSTLAQQHCRDEQPSQVSPALSHEAKESYQALVSDADTPVSSLLDEAPSATYVACLEMMRHHTVSEALYAEGLSRVAESSSFEDGSRMIVVSWMVEVAEEFGLQQETLHAAVSLLDSFLSTSNGVPRCVLQLVAVGCIFMACKTLEVHHPTVEQMVAVAAHSFTAGDLLRVERVLLDTLEFNPTTHTPYGFLHLLTQATLAATSNPSRCNQPAASAAIALVTGQDQPSVSGLYATEPAMEVVVSLAMYLTELALLDPSCLACPGSRLATAALLLAHTTLSGHCGAWPMMLTAAGLTQADVSPALAALQRLHMVTTAPASPQLAELLMPFKAKFSQDCWCRVAVDVTPWHHRL